MNAYSHSKARRLIQAGPTTRPADQRFLESHLSTCGDCRAFARSDLQLTLAIEQQLRSTLRAQIEPIPGLSQSPDAISAQRAIIHKRFKGETIMKRIIFLSAAMVGSIALLVLLVISPGFLPVALNLTPSAALPVSALSPVPSLSAVPVLAQPTLLPPTATWVPAPAENGPSESERQILFLTQPDAKTRRIYASQLDQIGATHLADITEAGWGGDFSPDGTRIAFMTGQPMEAQWLNVMNTDGTHMEPVLKALFQSAPAWSPNGTQIGIQVEEPAGWQLAIIDLNLRNENGQAAIQYIPLYGKTNLPPIWSPDGQKMALAISKTAAYWAALYVLDLTGDQAGTISLISTPNFWQWGVVDLTWSPDGQRLAYVVWDDQRQQVEIRAVGLDGSDFRSLAQPEFMDPRNMGFPHLSWSPDGRFLSWVAYQTGERNSVSPLIMRYDFETGESNRIRENQDGAINNTAWFPSSRGILFGTDTGLWRLNILDAMADSSVHQQVSNMRTIVSFVMTENGPKAVDSGATSGSIPLPVAPDLTPLPLACVYTGVLDPQAVVPPEVVDITKAHLRWIEAIDHDVLYGEPQSTGLLTAQGFSAVAEQAIRDIKPVYSSIRVQAAGPELIARTQPELSDSPAVACELWVLDTTVMCSETTMGRFRAENNPATFEWQVTGWRWFTCPEDLAATVSAGE